MAELESAGRARGERLARLLGLLVFGLPAALLLARWLRRAWSRCAG